MLKTPSGKLRARALPIPFDGEPGPLNSITDIAGVEVGYQTLIRGHGPLVRGQGPVRTGVTAVLPRGKAGANLGVFAGMFSQNGCGEMTGSQWVAEVGRCEGPITITNTHAVGTAHDAAIKWMVQRWERAGHWSLPVAGETYDGWLNDINGFHVTDADVYAALDNATGGAIEEGSVGGGTGMITYGFKGGSGTASRRVGFDGATYTVGAFVQSNFGSREQLTIGGVAVGKALKDWAPEARAGQETGSIIAIVGTDAPLLPHQLTRLTRRTTLGLGRSGAISGHGSGDIFLAFSTANAPALADSAAMLSASFIPDPELNPFFAATIQAVDEAILNSLIANETMIGADDRVVHALPHAELIRLLERR
ncbi:MAG TPA: P1 family peptidase [Caulobacteraceae bacterium]|nr:P1 family peptidase [Caulobacteraceae bacterium]